MSNILNINIKTDYIKLDQLLKFSGLAETGSFAKEIILNGNVFVNETKCLMRGKKIYKNDIVKVGEYTINVC